MRIQPCVSFRTVDSYFDWSLEIPSWFVTIFTLNWTESFWTFPPAVCIVDLGISYSLSVERLLHLTDRIVRISKSVFFYLDRGPVFLPALRSSFTGRTRWWSIKLHSRLQTFFAFDRKLHSMPVTVVPIILTRGFAFCSTGLGRIVAFPLAVQNRILCFQGLSCGNAI